MTNVIFQRAWTFLSRPRNSIITLIILAILGYVIFHYRGIDPNTVITDTVKKEDLKATVLATGAVTSTTDLVLSFNTSDIVRSIKAKVGDVVSAGALLAMLDNRDELATLTSAQGALLSAQANYKKIIEGATSEEIAVATVALKNAQTDLQNTTLTQDTLVVNAHRALLNTGLSAISNQSNNNTTSVTGPTISGTYTGTAEGTLILNTNTSGANGYFTVSNLINTTGEINTTTPVPIGMSGLFVQFPSNFSANSGIAWTIAIPNTQASGYVTAYNAYQSALQTKTNAIASAQSVVDARQADLDLKKAAARPVLLDVANADIVSAQGRVQAAEAAYDNTILRAPADGTITKVDIKLGELASVQKEVMVLQDVGHLYLEANINEANITQIKIGQPVTVTFDAFGPDRVVVATITQIDPSSTLVSGVVNYKITATLADITEIRPGMTANMTILINEKKDTLVVPTRAIMTKEDGSKVVRVITDPKRKTFIESPVTLGMVGDDGTEITSGVTVGQEIVVFINGAK